MAGRFQIRFKGETIGYYSTPEKAKHAWRDFESRKRKSGFQGLIEIVDTREEPGPAAWTKSANKSVRTGNQSRKY